MNPASPAQVRALLKERGLVPSKVLGQNFLIDANIRDIILDAAGVAPGEPVLEIGPGLGMLTAGLLDRGCRVVALEKDARFHGVLLELFAGEIQAGSLELVLADALKADLAEYVERGARRVLSNLPYSVGNRILVDLVMGRTPPESITVMVQRDVAERIVAPPGVSGRGILSVFCQLRYAIRTNKQVSPKCFVPPPKVWSTVLTLTRHADAQSEPGDMAAFKYWVRHCFEHRRKQVASILQHHPGLAAEPVVPLLGEIGIEPAARPETLDMPAWVALAGRLGAAYAPVHAGKIRNCR